MDGVLRQLHAVDLVERISRDRPVFFPRKELQ